MALPKMGLVEFPSGWMAKHRRFGLRWKDASSTVPEAIEIKICFIQSWIPEVKVSVWSWKLLLKADSIKLWGWSPYFLLNRRNKILLHELAGGRTKLDHWVRLLSKATNCMLREASLSPLRKNVWQVETATQYQTNGWFSAPKFNSVGRNIEPVVSVVLQLADSILCHCCSCCCCCFPFPLAQPYSHN